MTISCDRCGKKDTKEAPLQRCSKCSSAFYCGKECQQLAWPTHEADCKSKTGTSAPAGKMSQAAFDAALKGNIAMLETLKVTDNINQQLDSPGDPPHGRTLLHVAAAGGQIEVVEWLLEKGADQNLVDGFGVTPAYAAAHEGHIGVLQALGVTTDNINQQLDSPGERGLHGCTLLHTAAMGGQIEVVEWLLGKGADKSLSNARGVTPAYAAAHEGRIPVLEALGVTTDNINQQLDSPGERGLHGCTLLHAAALTGQTETVKWLLEKEADKSLSHGYGLTPTHFAALRGYIEVLEALGVTTGNINQQLDSPGNLALHGRTLLHVAAEAGQTETVKWLLEKRADTSLRNGNGLTPVHLAAENREIEVVEALLPPRLEY